MPYQKNVRPKGGKNGMIYIQMDKIDDDKAQDTDEKDKPFDA